MTTVYTLTRFPTKKSLKEVVKAGKKPAVKSESFFVDTIPDGKHTIVGPGPHERKWYGIVWVEDSRIVKVAQ